MKSHLILKQNIDGLLVERGLKRRDLARHVKGTFDKKADSWISHIFGKASYHTRTVPSEYFDKIADFFGYEVWQLFQPGIVKGSERRTGKERRIRADRRIIGKQPDWPTTPRRQVQVPPEVEALVEDLLSLPYEKVQHVRAWIVAAKLARNTGSGTPPPDEPPPVAPTDASIRGRLRMVKKKNRPPK